MGGRRGCYDRVSLGGLLLAGAFLVLTGLAESASAAPRVVLTTPRPIEELAVGRDQAVWRSSWREPFRVNGEIVAQHLATKERKRLARVSANPSYGFSVELAVLGFAGGRLLWQELLHDRFGIEESDVYVRRLTGARVRRVVSAFNDVWVLDGDRAPFLVGAIRGRIVNPGECLGEEDEPTSTCRWVPTGETFRLEGTRYRALRALQPTLALSASRGVLAAVPADPGETVGSSWSADPLSIVEVRRLEDGALVRTIPIGGTPRAITMSPTVLAVLVEVDGGLRIDRFRHDGTLLGSTAVPGRTAWRLESARSWIVARSRGRILAIDAVKGELTTLASLRTPPLELQARAGHVYWAANGRGDGRVLSLPLPTG